ncbi:MAG: right-handed parallel beta-helix repeat-containing protein [Akkermansiaceae bacterium]
MKRFLLVVWALVLGNLSIVTAADKADFFVAPNGSDAWSGTVDSPDDQKADGPFATLERARDAVRELRKINAGNITVLVRGGTYTLDKTVVFGLEDSGLENAFTTYKAYPGEKPVFSSGREITGLKKLTSKPAGLSSKAEGKVWVADVKGSFRTLYDEQGMLPRARSEGFFPLEGSGRDRLLFPEGKLKNWSNVSDVEIVVRPHHAWIVNILPVVSVDEEKGIARTSIESTYVMNPLHFLKTTPSCWVENVLEELDEPGEWVLNTKEGKLYIWPRDNAFESPIVAPQLLELIKVEGKVDIQGPKDIPVQNLHFEGLTFKHGERYTLTKEDAGLQHDWDMLDKDNALVRFCGTENCSVKKCHFLHSGSGAIRVDLHGIGNTISGNHIEHMGGGGILLCGYGPGTKDVNRKNIVSNNHIHHVGEIYWHSPGLMLWQSGENHVINNLIHHTNYTSLIVSGCMTEFFRKKGRELGRTIRRDEIGELPKKLTIEAVRPFLHSHDNVIEYNEIHNAMQKLGDGNAIYIRGAGAGNVIRRNYIHHLVTPMIMQCAVRTDGGQMDTLFSENVIYKCTSQGIMMKLNTRVENNFVVDVIMPPRGYYLSVREGPLTGATIKRNIFYSSDKVEEFISELKAKNKNASEDRRGRKVARAMDADTDYNIYFAAGDLASGKEMLEKQRGDGVDKNSQAVDPMFVDPENGDFRFKPDSPALKMGIVPIDVSKAGLKDETE